MTRKIIEYENPNSYTFEFVNLNSYEDIFLVSFLLEHEMGAKAFESDFNTYRKFALNDLIFTITEDCNHLRLTLSIGKIESSRQVTRELLNLIRTKGRKFVSKKGKELLSASWKASMIPGEDFYH